MIDAAPSSVIGPALPVCSIVMRPCLKMPLRSVAHRITQLLGHRRLFWLETRDCKIMRVWVMAVVIQNYENSALAHLYTDHCSRYNLHHKRFAATALFLCMPVSIWLISIVDSSLLQSTYLCLGS